MITVGNSFEKRGLARVLLLSSVCFLSSAASVLAQEAGGLNATFDVGQRLDYREEEGFAAGDVSEFRSLTTLGFGISSETRNQSIAFDVSSGLAITLGDDSETTFEGTQATLDYTLDNRENLLTFNTRYRRDQVDDLVFETTMVDDEVATGVGLREVTTVTTGLTLGRESRVTGVFGYSYENSEFSDVLDPSLNDSDRQNAEARISFGLTRTATVDLFGAWGEVDEQGAGATDRETRRAGIGLEYEISPITTVTGEIAYSEEESRGDTIDETEGFNYALSVVRARPNGAINLNYTQADTLNGARRQLTAGQELTLRRGTLNYALGATRTEGFDAQLLANLTYSYELDRNSTTGITLSQIGTINSDDEEVVNTRFDLSYTRALSRVSEINAGLAVVDENVLEDGAADQRSIRFDVNYGYEVGRDWLLTSGYEYSTVRVDGEDDRDRSTVYIGLSRSYAYRP